MSFKPFPCRSRWEGLLAISWIFLVDVLLLIWIWRRPPDWISFLCVLIMLTSLPLLYRLGYRTWGAFNLEYWLERDALHIRWAATEQIVPLTAIRRVVWGGQEIGSRSIINWPSPFVRSSTGLGILNLERFATRSLPDCLLVETDDVTFAISPHGADRFVQALRRYNSLGPLHSASMERRRPSLCEENGAAIGIAPGGFPHLILVGMIGVLLLFGILMVRYPTLPDPLPFHFSSTGNPDSIRSKSSLFLLPTIGLLTFLVNGASGVWMACRGQRTGAYLLWGGTLVVQLLVLLALLSLI